MTARLMAVLLVVVAAACTGQALTADPAPVPTGTEVDSPDPAPPSPSETSTPVPVDWSVEGDDDVDLGGGWTAGGCEGDAPILCVAREGDAVGLVESLTFPLEPAVAGADDPLAAQVQAILESHRSDREAGCPDGYAVVMPPPTRATVAGQDGLRYEFAVHGDGGRRVEHVVGFVAIRDDHVRLVVANAIGEGSCVVDDEFAGFTPETLAAFGDRLDRVVAGSRLPDE